MRAPASSVASAALALLFTSGCWGGLAVLNRPSTRELRQRASHDLACPPKALAVGVLASGNQADVRGCGKWTTYAVACPLDANGEAGTCTWVPAPR